MREEEKNAKCSTLSLSLNQGKDATAGHLVGCHAVVATTTVEIFVVMAFT